MKAPPEILFVQFNEFGTFTAVFDTEDAAIADEAAWPECKTMRYRLIPSAGDDTYMSPEHGWTCFHCGDTFMGIAAARAHFGAKPDAVPGCLLRMQPGERPLLRMIRSLEADVATLRSQPPTSKACDNINGACDDYPSCQCGRAVRAAPREGGGT